MIKVGISASFFHEDPKRAIFKGMTLQYIEQNVAHWLMQRDVLSFMIPSPDGRTRREDSRITLDAYAQELDGLVLMGGSDLCPETYGEKAIRPEWNGDRVRDEYEIGLLNAFVARRKPALGVCRGAPVINVAMGGTLWQGGVTATLPGWRTEFLTQLGFTIPDGLSGYARGHQAVIPLDKLASVLDSADVLIWTTESDDEQHRHAERRDDPAGGRRRGVLE